MEIDEYVFCGRNCRENVILAIVKSPEKCYVVLSK
jgi:hypothetical protein